MFFYKRGVFFHYLNDDSRDRASPNFTSQSEAIAYCFNICACIKLRPNSLSFQLESDLNSRNQGNSYIHEYTI
ncbi:hypothetical protein [Spirulina sp. 06S082]|uniref:hypothetical protein n=1 Tax=Spirulina sp. 06S082 TaxID=3110248 RepID=UPI002B1EC2FF|nr:hypothetical protein [Spirulina sp. 06S082]MEA5470595.1 hypothetical protein [Spirulina sp. 06S082]